VKLKNKIKGLNVPNVEKSEEKEGDASELFNQKPEQMQEDFKDIFNQAHSRGPITRADAKLIKYKDAMQLAL
jgi:hypothetical protein